MIVWSVARALLREKIVCSVIKEEKALGVKMRKILAITLMIAASSASALDRSGMFVCTPQSSQDKPIIYSFDGEYLIRDNNLQVPFTKVSSLTDNMDLYFAFEPTYMADRKFALRKLLQDDSELITSELADFTKFCNSKYTEGIKLKSFYEDYDSRSGKLQLEPVSNLVGVFGNLSCHKKTKESVENFFAPITDEEYHHVKLTINFDKMWVIEERVQNGGVSQKYEDFNEKMAVKYQCKSLGIDVPEVDTSESIVPLASNI